MKGGFDSPPDDGGHDSTGYDWQEIQERLEREFGRLNGASRDPVLDELDRARP